MSKYNKTLKLQQPDIVNRAGGEAYSESPKVALVNLLLTSFQKDKFYETSKDEQARLLVLLAQNDPLFVAKATIFARKQFGMRSITHFSAAWVAKNIKGQKWTKAFFRNVVHRPDDMLEILAAYNQLNGGLHPIPNALKRGFREKLQTLKAYQVAKYKGEGKTLKLVDLVNLLHPSSLSADSAIAQLVHGTLSPADTWEASLSKAGNTDGGEEAVEAAKTEEWERLLKEKKLGYMALLRNLRNIVEADVDDEAFEALLEQLVDPKAIKNSLVFPFRILVAYLTVKLMTGGYRKKPDSPMLFPDKTALMEALTDAMDLSLRNVPDLPGKTLVALDMSGSMTLCTINSRNKEPSSVRIAPHDIGAIFAAAMAKKGAELILFDDEAHYYPVNTRDSIISIAERLPNESGGTDFRTIFKCANTEYDRIIILSDMQAWVGHASPAEAFYRYKQRIGCSPVIFCVNLASYGDAQFPENKVYQLAGFSDKIFDTMKYLEQDKEALVHEIEAIELSLLPRP